MEKLSPELARILAKRIRKVLEKAKYYPATVRDLDAAAKSVVAPFIAKPKEGA